MRVSLCTISNKETAVEEVVALAGEVGYDGVEVWGDDHVGDGGEAACRRITDAAADAGVTVPVYSSYLRAGTDGFAADLPHEVTVADRLGADLIRVWAGDEEYGDHDPAHFDRVAADLREVAERAADVGVGVTVEKHPGTLTNTLNGAREVLDAVDRSNCGLNYQPGFSVPADTIAREVEALGPRTNHCHLQAVRERGSTHRCPLSEAFYDVEGVVDGLRSAGFDGYASVEFVTEERPYREAVADDLEYLRSLA